MSRPLILFAATLIVCSALSAAGAEPAGVVVTSVDRLPVLDKKSLQPVKTDWLVVPTKRRTGVFRGGNGKEIILTNGLISRTFRMQPNAATVGYDNLMTRETILRGVKPEAMVELNGVKYPVGGLLGQVEYAYLRPDWVDSMTADSGAFQCVGFEVGTTKCRFPWKRKRYAADLPWPPPGASLMLRFKPPQGKHPGVILSVHYEMYDGIPLLSKWLTIENGGDKPVTLNTFTVEILAAVQCESTVVRQDRRHHPSIHVESDYAFNSGTPEAADQTTHWVLDPQYTTQRCRTPLLLESRPPMGPDVIINPGGTLESFRTYELILDSVDRERKGLAQRKMYRTVAPWVTENPIVMHVLPATPASVRLVIDQCAEVGFEMVVLSFGSGFNMENEDPAYLAQIKQLADYAHGKGIELGGYSLLASRSAGPENDCIDRRTGKPGGAVYGRGGCSVCLGSRWGKDYFRKLRAFFEKTGLDWLSNDGSYPGDTCASTSHPGHRGLNDSQWRQWKQITDFYKWCRARGVYLSVPDWYFLSGSSKVFLGYREENWTLPRERQIILGRQNIFDGTFRKTPSMGWTFLPLVAYKGGNAAAILEPLAKHLDTYQWHLAQNFGSGVHAYYRGPRLYDTDETKAVVKKWTDFYRQYRDILDSDIIHVRRPDGRDIDCMLHVNPRLKHKGLAMIYNPLKRKVSSLLSLPLYYTGLTDVAVIRRQGGEPKQYRLNRDYRVELPVAVEPESFTWFVIE